MSFKINNIILQQSEQQSLNILNNNNNINNSGLVVPISIVNTNATGIISQDGIIYYGSFYDTYTPDSISIDYSNGLFTNNSNNLILLYINFLLVYNNTVNNGIFLYIKSTILGDKEINLNTTSNNNRYLNIPLLSGDYFYIGTSDTIIFTTNTLTIFRTY